MNLRFNKLQLWSLALFAIVLGGSAGCRSTSRWNPTSWFANREPDAAMIAGRSGAPELPTSPALNHSPTALANNYNATGGSPANTPLNSPAGAASALAQNNAVSPMGSSPYAASPYSTAGTNQSRAVGPNGNQSLAYGQPSPSGTVPESGGLAARSNGFQQGGYQTGPYGMSEAPKAPNNAVSAVSASTNKMLTGSGANTSNSGSFPNPYGGSYGSAPSNLNSMANSVANTEPPVVPSMPTAGHSVNSVVPSSGPDYPSLPAFPVSATMNGANSVPTSTNSVPGSNTVSTASLPVPQLGTTGSVGSSAPVGGYPTIPSVPGPSAYQSAPNGSFTPGTTGRSTNYNFGNGPASGNSQTAPPSSFPSNTATGSSSFLR